jgi:hypothetical protein
MVARTASVLVCDDLLYGLTGKVLLQGVYTTDITIPGDELLVQQLVFYFSAQTPKENPFKSITLQVTPPVGDPAQLIVPVLAIPAFTNPNRDVMIFRAPILVQQWLLRPGKIETTVITESGELDAGGIWVASVSKANPS